MLVWSYIYHSLGLVRVNEEPFDKRNKRFFEVGHNHHLRLIELCLKSQHHYRTERSHGMKTYTEVIELHFPIKSDNTNL